MPIPSWEQCPQEGGRGKVKIEKPPQYPILHISFTPLHFCSIFLFKDTVFIILHLTSISFLGKVLHKELLKIYPHKPRVVSLSPILSPPQFNTHLPFTLMTILLQMFWLLCQTHIFIHAVILKTHYFYCFYSYIFWLVCFVRIPIHSGWFISLSFCYHWKKYAAAINFLLSYSHFFLSSCWVFFPSSNDRSFLENFRRFFNLKL